ncbi:MAG: DUF2071 domain-containing protein, partial [Chloroflexi bacterium]|nr:DUF2071 domain-containing protein [Chloroflexota bacterium]
YVSRRTHTSAPAAEFVADYEPTGQPYSATRGSLEHWLTERYCLYAADSTGALYRAEIHHGPWPLQSATATIRMNTMAAAHGITLPNSPPLLHFSRRLDMVNWGLVRV